MLNEVPCPKCKGKGYIEAYKNINNGECYYCHTKGKVSKERAKKFWEDCRKIQEALKS